jgi:arylsulfatase A-like enzyme
MNTRVALALQAAAAALLLTACREASAGASRPNVVLVSFDTLRADHLSCYGYERKTSPVIDDLARDGLLFGSAYSQSNKTVPAHMSILTGLLPAAHGVLNLGEEGNRRLAEGVPTLASLLQERGWRTAAFTAGGHVGAELGFDEGFDVFETGGGVKGMFEKGGEFAEEGGDEPFFLFLHTYEVHDPYVPPKGFRDLWTDENYAGAIVSSRKELKELSGEDWETQHEAFWKRVDDASEADRAQLIALYDGSIRYADKQLGEFLDRLASRGELEDTLIVFLSDHGEEFREHDGWLHETVYQELLHVPLIVRPAADMLPGSRGKRLDTVVRLVDVLPTVLELLDLPAPEGLQGQSLVSLAEGDSEGSGEQAGPVLSQWPREDLFALRSGQWKLVLRLGADGKPERTELYDLAADPGELESLAEAEPERVEELTDQLFVLLGESAALGLAVGGEVSLSEGLRAQLGNLGYLSGRAPEEDESEETERGGAGATAVENPPEGGEQ